MDDSNGRVIDLKEYRDRKQGGGSGATAPLGNVTELFSFEDRLRRLQASIIRINQLMEELKNGVKKEDRRE